MKGNFKDRLRTTNGRSDFYFVLFNLLFISIEIYLLIIDSIF